MPLTLTGSGSQYQGGSGVVVVTDDFNRTDEDPLNSTDWDVGHVGSTKYFSVVSNAAVINNQSQAASVSYEWWAIHKTSVGGTNHYVQVDFDISSRTTYNGGIYVGLVTRADDASNYYFHKINMYHDTAAARGDAYFYKVIADSATYIGQSLDDGSQTNQDTGAIKCTSNGNTHKVYIDTVEFGTIDDSSLTTGTRCGMYIQSARLSTPTGGSYITPKYDNFEASTL